MLQIGRKVRVKAKEGFTFVELLIVTTIVMILASIAVPYFRTSYERFKLQTLYGRFEHLVRTAHELAILEGRIYLIKIPSESPSFALYRETRDDETPYQRFGGNAGKDQRIPDRYELKTTRSEIFFYPDGAVTPTQIELSNHFANAIRFDIDANGKILDQP